MVGAARYRVHPAGRLRAHRLPRRSRGPAHLDRGRPGRVHGRGLGGIRRDGAAPSRGTRRPGWAPRLVHARSDHVDAEQRMAALAATAEATRQALGRGAVDRARQGRLRRHQHGHGSTVAGLRGDGRLPRFHRDSATALPDRAMGLPRLDSGTNRPVDAREDRLRDRRARTALPAAAGSARQRFDDPGDGSSAGAWRVHRQSRGIPATARTVADVGRQPGAGAPRSRGRGSRRRLRLGAKGIGTSHTVRGGATRRCAGRRFHGVLGRPRRRAFVGGARSRRHQDRVDPATRRHPVFRRHAHRRRRLVGVRLGVPCDEHQQAVGHARPAVHRR